MGPYIRLQFDRRGNISVMENFFWATFLQALEIFTLVVGIVGVGLSTLLLLSPHLFNRIGDALSRSIQVDKKISRHVDRSIPTAAFTHQFF
jgi:hypothetical protein